MSYLTGVIYVVLSSIGFGVMPIFAKLAYKSGLDTYTLVLFRFSFAAAILGIYIWLKRVPLRITKKQRNLIIILGFAGYSLTAITLFASYKYISVSMASTIHFIYPAMVTIASFFILKEKFHLRKILSLMASAAGLIILVAGNDTNLNFLGVFFAIISAAFYSLYVVGISLQDMKHMDSILLSFYICLVSSVSIFFIRLILGSNCVINSMGLLYAFLTALLSTAIPLLLFVKGVKVIGSSNGAILSTLEPIVGVILGVIILGETMTIRILIGCILILVSVFILSSKGEKTNESCEASIKNN